MIPEYSQSIGLRTYARTDPDTGDTESMEDVYTRCLNEFEKQANKVWDVEFLERERILPADWKSLWFDFMRSGKALPAGRMLWALGSRTVTTEGFLPLVNCSFVKIDDPVDPFLFMAKMLFLGCGCGFSVEGSNIEKARQKFDSLRKLEDPLARTRYVVPEDSKEGYIFAIEGAIWAGSARRPYVVDTYKLRPAGSPIRGFGGVSGDPKVLWEVCMRIYKMHHDAKEYSTSLAFDTACSIGELVVSGNVRRSALISIGDIWDKEYLDLKKFSEMSERPWRRFCNASVNIRSSDDLRLSEHYWDTYRGESEAYGFVNIEKCREQEAAVGRWKKNHFDYFPPEGFNPCGEQPLANREVCNLGEVNILKALTASDKSSWDQLDQCVAMCYLFCKLCYTYGCPTEKLTEEICSANQRIGVSLSGLAVHRLKEKTEFWYNIDRCRRRLHEIDETLSDHHGVNKSVAITTIKPGGTLSKIMGCPVSGIHQPLSQYMIRRVVFAKNSCLVPQLIERGIPVKPVIMVNGKPDPTGAVVAEFYLKNGDFHPRDLATSQLTYDGLERFLELIIKAQLHWSDNSVSVTAYYDSVEQLQECLLQGWRDKISCLKTFSAMKYYGHNFPQPVEEPITKEQFEDWCYNVYKVGMSDTPLKITKFGDGTPLEDFGGCERGTCSDK